MADFAQTIQVLQLILSLLIIPLLGVLFKLYDKLRDLEISIEKRFVTKEEHAAIIERLDEHVKSSHGQNRFKAMPG